MRAGTNFLGSRRVLSISVTSRDVFDETVVAAFEHLNDGIIELTMKEVEGRFQRFLRVKQSPISGFHTDAVPYNIVDKKPRLLTSSAEP